VRWWILLPAVALAVAGSAMAEPGNPVAVAAAYHAGTVRGYTCGNWPYLAAANRTDYLLGVIALADTLYASDRLDPLMDQAVRLPQSAVAYRSLVDSGCLFVSASTPVLAVLYSLK
jgi:hypothetical protein